MCWKHSYFWCPGTHRKRAALPYFLHAVIHLLWCASVGCHDGLRNSVRSGALDATLHIVAESRLRGFSARSILPTDVVVTSRHATTATWWPAGTPTTQPCKTSTCCQSSVDKATWLQGFAVDASDVFSSIGFTTTTLAPPLRQASQCRHSSLTTIVIHPAGLERRVVLMLHHVRPYRGHLSELGLVLHHVRRYRGHLFDLGLVDPHAGKGGVFVHRSVRQRYTPRQELDRARWLLEFRPPAVPAMQHPHISLASVTYAGHSDPWRTLVAVSVNRHIAQHVRYRQVSLETLYSTHPLYIYTMGWNGGKGKGSWNQGNGGNGSSPGNDSGQDGTGSARYAYSQLYKEREKLREVQEAMRKKEEKEERVKELAQFKDELAAAKKGNSVEDSIYASMIGDNGEKKKEEPASQSMVSSMMKMLRRLTGNKSNDKKRPRSSSRSSSSSSSKKHKKTKKDKKKHRSSGAKSSRDSPKEKKSRKRSPSSSSNHTPPLPIKFPDKKGSSRRESGKGSDRKDSEKSPSKKCSWLSTSSS